jgi:hypothetical protein
MDGQRHPMRPAKLGIQGPGEMTRALVEYVEQLAELVHETGMGAEGRQRLLQRVSSDHLVQDGEVQSCQQPSMVRRNAADRRAQRGTPERGEAKLVVCRANAFVIRRS